MENYLKILANVVQSETQPIVLSMGIASHDAASMPIVNVTWKQTNFEISTARKYVTSYRFDSKEGIKRLPLFPVQVNTGLLEKISPSKLLKATISKKENAGTKKEEFILEITSHTKLVQTINLSSFDKHGPIHADPYFSGLQWSDDETKLVYVAEKKKPKNLGFFERQPKKEKQNAEEKEKKDESTIGEKYSYEESWGELLNEITNTCLVVIDLKQESCSVVDNIPNNVCPAQPQWFDQNSLLFTGYDVNPFRLGLRVCECRQSRLYVVKMSENESQVTQLSSANNDSISEHSARISISKSKVMYIQRLLNPAGNLHRGVEVLMLYDTSTSSSSVLFGNDELLFAHSLPDNCWLSDDIHAVFPNDQNGLKYAVVINTTTGGIKKKIECNALFNVESNLVFMVDHMLDSAGATLKIACLNENAEIVVHAEQPQKDKSIEYGSIVDEHGVVSFYTIPSEGAKPYPLIVLPHGGPNVMCSNNFRRDTAVFSKLGYAVLLCNYRGSTGFNQNILDALAGHVGDVEIKDVQNFVNLFMNKFGDSVNKQQVYAYGGSHGGFIGAHLIGQYPEFYCAAALLNPVIDIASMMMVTDIPDWTFVESGLPYTQDTIPSAEIYSKMIQMSPVVHIKNVKAPVLLCIGGKDMRVPPSQGKSYYRLLQANKKIAKLLYYPEDSHPLMNIETDGDFFVNVCKWFQNHKPIVKE